MPLDRTAVTLEFLLVSDESFTVNAVEAGLQEVGGRLQCTLSPDAAGELITTRKVDGVILDTDIKHALDLIARMRRSKNARAFAFVCVRNDAEEAVALKGGATALLTKPLQAQTVADTFKSFKSIMISERRRCQRHDVTLPAVVSLGQNTYQAIVENISQGGMAVRLPCLLADSVMVEFSFELESGAAIEGSAQLKWANRDGLAGMEFQALSAGSKDKLISWLRELTAAPDSPQQAM
jgi:response regulator RpfG family c-di-GMP phosphodiesterase